MRAFLIRIVFLFFYTFCFSQTQIATINDTYKNRVIMPNEVVPLTNTINDQYAIFLFKDNIINGYLFDKNNQIINSLESEDKQKKYKQILGKTILTNGDFVVFMSNNSRRKFASARFSFPENKVIVNELDLDLENEKILQTSDFENKFHLLTISPKTSTINVYRFNDANSYTKFPIDFSNEIFYNQKQKEADLYQMLTVKSGAYGLSKTIDLVKIESDNPTTLEMACNYTKVYTQDENVIFTFDENKTITQLVNINLKTMDASVKQIKKALDNWAYRELESNSFLCVDLLYQIVTSKRVIHLRAQNFKTGEIINEHTANFDEKITFKNSSIAQNGGTFDKFREFEDTSILLRKVMRGKAGIAVQRTGKLYHVTYGGVIEKASNAGGMMMPGFGLPIASIGAVTVFFNPTFFAYQSHTSTKSLKVDALFNSNFEHQTGNVEENAFERIQTFEDENRISPAGRTVFKLKNKYILGSYDSYKRTYTLRSF